MSSASSPDGTSRMAWLAILHWLLGRVFFRRITNTQIHKRTVWNNFFGWRLLRICVLVRFRLVFFLGYPTQINFKYFFLIV